MDKFFTHPTAVVDSGAQIGEGTKIWHFCHVSAKARIGPHRIGPQCSLGQNVFIADDVVIGRNVKIQNNVSIYQGVELADNVFCGPSMVFTNVINPRSHVSRRNEYKSTRVGQGVTFGANCTIVCGHTIGEFAFVGAGAVVTHDVPAYALMLGVPARRAGWMCACGERLTGGGSVRCASCEKTYQISSNACNKVP
jgi:UDP-2-acetamido-3-amino-2,3-dideoxy-glucuronate N-acetyltransferase